jgi:hypothetical protein
MGWDGRSLKDCVLLPEVDAGLILVELKGHTTAAILLAQSVAHDSDRLHGRFTVDVLRLDADDAVVVVDVLVGILQTLRFVLEHDLLL